MRPRERYAHDGPTPFGDAELLALVLGTGTRGASALELAASILARFGGLGGVAHADPSQLQGMSGLGLARATRVHAALQLGRRSLQAPGPREPVTDPEGAHAILAPRLRGLVDEELHGLFLDRRRQPVAVRALTRGTAAYTIVDPRQIFRVALSVGASAVVLAHNHPSGDATPSRQDREVTRRVGDAGQVLGVPLLDHLVIGASGFTSLAERGELPAWRPPPTLWV